MGPRAEPPGASLAPGSRAGEQTPASVALLALVWLLTAGCSHRPSSIVRVVDGHELEGRYIPPEAYALYLRGAYHEARDEADLAIEAYDRALEYDPESVELHARRGAVACRHRGATPRSAFGRALAIAPDHPPLLRELAACHLARGELDAARAQALRAMRSAPRDEESTRVLAAVLERRGEAEEAARWTEAFARFMPSFRGASSSPAAADGAAESVKRALSRGDVKRARAEAAAARMTPAEIALLAAELGRGAVALEQALFVLAADPENAEAWVAGVAGADLAGRDDALGALLRRVPGGIDGLSPRAVELLAGVVGRRCGEAARTAIAGTAPPESAQ